MAVLKNKTQKDFTMISNSVLRDRNLSMKDRGVFCTLCSLPDGWEFSIAGLSAIVPDGKDAIRASLDNLENLGYMHRLKKRAKDGKYVSEIEVFASGKRKATAELPSRENRHGQSDTEKPSRVDRYGDAVTANPTEYNTDNYKNEIKNDNDKSINPSEDIFLTERENDEESMRKIIAENIKLGWLLESAGKDPNEVGMVNEIYDVICDMVCYPRKEVVIKDTRYPWKTVRERFLKLNYDNIADVLNRIIDKDLEIKNMSNYLISTLYSASLVGTLESQANLHDDYLKFLRGQPY